MNLGKRITKNPKVYFTDCGLVCFLTGIRDKKYLLNGPMAGPLFENFVIQETLKSYANRVKKPNMFYLRTHNDLEIDLIIEKNMKIFPFEVKLSKSPNINIARPIERFKKIFPKLNIMAGKIICLSDKNYFLVGGVSTQCLDDYLEWVKS
jgi:predicted AAA+ superfamily ATPase